MKLNGQFEIDASRDLVFKQIINPGLMAECIPGCEVIERIDSTRYRAVVVVGMGVVKARFDLVVAITSEDPPFEVRSQTTGIEGARASSLVAENRMWLTDLGDSKTRVEYESEVNITGRLGKFGLGVMRKYLEKIGVRFAENFKAGILSADTEVIPHKTHEQESTPIQSDPELLETTPTAHTMPENFETQGQNGSVCFPESVEDAVRLLVDEVDSFPLAGGATLVAMRNAGLVKVEKYICLERIEALHGISVQDDGRIRIGSMTRHYEVAGSTVLTGNLAVIRQAAASIANMPVRNMGTMGGALAHADPAADYLAALAVVDAEIELFGPGGVRTVGIGEWILNWYETCLNANELIKAIYLPLPAESYSSYRKVARVSGDYAVATCAISVEPHHHQVRIAIGGCGPAPLRDPDQEFALRDESLVDDELQNLVKNLITQADPIDDVRGSAEHRFRLIPRLARDAVTGLLEAHASSS
jgi:CO/xanthine dehydrogenase FAD-binding subunit/carbon monoxide dehydrogenase subunit G